MVGSKLFKVRDLIDRYGDTPRAVYRWISDSKLDAIKISGRIRIPEGGIDRQGG